MNFGGYDLGDYKLLGIPDFGGIALWRLQFWRLRALEVTVLEFLILSLFACPFFVMHFFVHVNFRFVSVIFFVRIFCSCIFSSVVRDWRAHQPRAYFVFQLQAVGIFTPYRDFFRVSLISLCLKTFRRGVARSRRYLGAVK